jgi:tetratricopeptide (TPR) repeat protein
VDAHLYAMRYTAESFAAEIDAQLVRHGFLPPDASGARTWDKLPGAIQQTGKCPVIVVDGLNESQSCWRIAEDVLRTLSEVSVVLVGTQDLPPADGPLPLLKTLGAKEAIDLGAPGIQQETDADVRCYIETRLAGVRAPAMDVAKIADGIVEIASRQDAGAFLVARFITAQLSEAPVDTSLPNWQGELAHSIEKTFESFIAGLPKLQRGVDQLPHAARDLMEALPWARGPGLPDDIWPIMATALSGTTYDRSDVRWLLNSAERYIVEDGQGGRAVYRFVHQWLTDYLRPGKRGEADSDDGSIKVARALVDYYERLLTAGQPPQMSAYLWRYAWLHCADAGAPGIEAFRKLVARDANAFERQLAMALSAVSKKVGGGGLWREALGAAQEAAEIYRRLADGGQNPRTELAEALVTQAWLQMMVKPEEAIQPAQQAIELFNQMDTANPAVGLPLASALTVLSLSYVQTGSLTETLKHASSAVKLLKQLSSDNPAFGPELANALTAQGVGFFQAGQPHQSADAAQEAVKLFKTAEPGNPFVRLGLAWALEVLSISHAQLGQAKEAVDAAHQAVELSSPMLAATPAAGPVLAGALSALGLGYVQNGQPKDAVDAAKKAIDLLGSMDSSNATVRIPLAAAQTVLGQASLQVGEAQQTVDAVKKAIDLLKPLDAANPVICTLLASALTFQALAYLQIGQTQQGLDAAKDASDLLESMDPGHPGVDVQLASALTVSSQCYMQSGDPERSMAAADQAVKLFRAAKAANPSVQLGLAGALTLLGTSLAELGHAKEAVCALSQAVDLFRPLQAAIPTARLQLASALAALAFATEQPDKQVEAATEAIRLFRIIDSSNAAARLSFASALAVQGQAYVQTERPKEAVGALKEATEILSSLDMANPTVCTLLAVTLNALGQAHFQTGQTQAAIDALKRALGIFQGLSRSDPKGLPEVARTLVNLDKCCRPAGRENEIDAQWEASLAAVDRPGDKAFLLIRRADGRRPQDPLAVPELLQAQAYLTLADKSGALAADLHEVCRLRRAPNPAAFDATWQSSGGGELPAWLTLDQAFLNTITEWLTKEPLEARKEFLAQHIASLNPGSDSVAFDEFALRFADLPGEAADRLAREIEFSRECLHSARELGIDKAYQPVFAGKLLLDWIALDDQAETFAMLKDRRKDLLDDEVEKVLHSLLLQFPQDLRLIAAAAILDLTRAGKEDLAFELMGNPEGAPAALLDLARSGNADVLHPLATILSLTGATDQLKALACFYKAVALAMKGGTELALQAVAEARLLNPTQENAWLALLFQFGGQRDRLIPISEALTAPQIPKAAEA